MVSKLTPSQQKMFLGLGYGIPVYVFLNDKGEHTFSYYKDNTCARVYTTKTAKSLIKKGYVKVKLCDVEGSLDNCLGVLEIV